VYYYADDDDVECMPSTLHAGESTARRRGTAEIKSNRCKNYATIVVGYVRVCVLYASSIRHSRRRNE